MSVVPGNGPGLSRGARAAEALYFGSADRAKFGWLHRPRGGSHCDLGIVICKPFGYEGLCAHRSIRAFAEACAALGAPTLRFDYAGTGDSAALDPAADQLETWTADVAAAVEALRVLGGVRRVCLLGIRLGGLLAALAARRCRDVEALVLVSPILSGQQFLREVRITRLAAALLAGGTDDGSASPGSLEVSGFHLAAATVAALAATDLRNDRPPAVASMLVIDSASLPTAQAWTEKMSEAGATVAYHALPGLIEMAFTAPQFAKVPKDMVATVCQWLTDGPLGAASQLVSPPCAQAATVIELEHGSTGQGSISERPVWFGVDGALFGVMTEPRRGEVRRRAVLILNSGADAHIGASGVSVELAREWAQRGYFVLRMDFAGIGDSLTRGGRRDNEVFPPDAVSDMRAAVEYLRSRHAARDLTIVGMCSGAYHTLQSAVAGLAVDRILMVNPQNYFWDSGMSIHGMQVAELVSQPQGGSLQRKLLSFAWWRRLLMGDVDVRYLTMRSARRVWLHADSSLRNLGRTLNIRLPKDLGWNLEEIAQRGVRIVFIFARGEPGIDLLKLQAGNSLHRLGNQVRLHLVDGADHVFSKWGPRQRLKKILSDELSVRSRSVVPTGQLVPQTTAE